MTSIDPTVKSARRIFEVFEYFELVQRPISLKELAGRYEYPTSSASALLKSMVISGYLSYDKYSRSYMPTMRIAQLGQWLKSGLFGESSILAMVEFIHEKLDELVSISTQSDLHAQYIHCLQTGKRLRFEIKAGDIRPLAHSGVGKVMLSTYTDEEIAMLLKKINAISPAAERVDLPSLMETIHDIRKDGFMFSKHVITQDAGVIAIPLSRRSSGRLLVLGVGGPVTRLEERFDEILACMKCAVERYLHN